MGRGPFVVKNFLPAARGRRPADSGLKEDRLLIEGRLDRVSLFGFPKSTVDGAPRKPVQDDATQEVRIDLLNLLGLRCHVVWETNIDLHGAGGPHTHVALRG